MQCTRRMPISSLISFVALVALTACSKESPNNGGQRVPTAAPTAAAGDKLELGKDTEVTQGKTYRVGDVEVTVVNISMASGQDQEGHDTHWIQMKLRIEPPGGQGSELELAGDQPAEAGGLTFRADALGYQWGATPATATLRVERK